MCTAAYTPTTPSMPIRIGYLIYTKRSAVLCTQSIITPKQNSLPDNCCLYVEYHACHITPPIHRLPTP